ncbi:MAG: filamentous hemagglutinin N-terminal domain-containing protein, partial [Rhodospirillales bacterium]|nr:filamentous hemagglutinin N-terminal domain-containing protein [Rhodospirillales bacterium]
MLVAGSRRRALLLGTALQAVGLVALPAPFRSLHAQPAPNAAPVGGVVVGGSASISRAPGVTLIQQNSPRTAIDWQSFDVGAAQAVTFAQPNAAAVALNRVTGPNPSQIAGRITANGQVILENQDGITFYRGAQVNTAGFIATAAGITTPNFMAGRMLFDQAAHPGATIVNQGNITVAEAGIAALVAPSVANSGVIEARLGRVALAGAERWALDLYGDGLVSIDVTGAVTQVPAGPGGKPVAALVTNSGTILAPGGEIELTAREAAGLVQGLVSAGGTVSAPTVGTQAGTIILGGVGGSIAVAGALLAQGIAPGTTGGAIEVAPVGGGVTLAAGARLDASGAAGGGVIAVGTDLGRARGGPGTKPALLSPTVTVVAGASLAANATTSGNGGRIVVLSANETVMDGWIGARGGPAGGNGGFVEVSGERLGFAGGIDLGAPLGDVGTVLFDPGTLTVIVGNSLAGNLDGSLPSIVFGTNSTTSSDTVSNGAIDQIGSTANILLQATTLVDVNAPIAVTNGLTIQSGLDMNVTAPISGGSVELDAGRNFVLGGGVGLVPSVTATNGNVVIQAGTAIAAGTMTLNGPVTAQFGTTFTGGNVFLSAGSGGIAIDNQVSATNAISLRTDALAFGAGTL